MGTLSHKNHTMLAVIIGCLMCVAGWQAEGGETRSPAARETAVNAVSLSRGVTVELAGLCTYPTDNDSWWRPDGSPLHKPSFLPMNVSVPGSALAYAFVVNVNAAVDFDCSITGAGLNMARPRLVNKKPTLYQHGIVAILPERASVAKQVDVHVGVGADKERVLAVYDANRKFMPATIEYADGGAVFHEPYEEADKLVVIASYTDHAPYRKTWLVACDVDDKLRDQERVSCATTYGFVSARYVFPALPKAQLARVELRSQAFEWVVFRNVSLAAGHRTQVTADTLFNPNDRVGEQAPDRAGAEGESLGQLVGHSVEPFELPAADGKTWRLADSRARLVLINIFATWCGPCQSEMPSLTRLRREYPADVLDIVIIAWKEDLSVVRKYAAMHSLPFPILVDRQGQVARPFETASGGTVLPTNVLLDAKRNVVYAARGFTEEGCKSLRQAIAESLRSQSE